jgi:hypothetical protein
MNILIILSYHSNRMACLIVFVLIRLMESIRPVIPFNTMLPDMFDEVRVFDAVKANQVHLLG